MSIIIFCFIFIFIEKLNFCRKGTVINKVYTEKPVLVSGGNGFVGSWVVQKLLDKGLSVHVTVRDINDDSKVRHLNKMSENSPGKIQLYEADLLIDDSFREAMKGCEIVFHTASPFYFKFKDAVQEFYNPIVKGTENILETVNNTKSVKTVVLTSTGWATYGDNADIADTPNGILNEDCWNKSSSLAHLPYAYSKVTAEKLAWEISKKQKSWELKVINPVNPVGATKSGFSTSGTHELYVQLGNGAMKTGAPPVEFGIVDIEDVADAHLEAAFNKNATGRFLIFGEVMSLLSLANILREKFGDKYPIPTKEMPKWLVWLVAPLIDKTLSRKYIARNMGHPWRGDNSKSVKVLGIKYKPIEKSAIEMFQQMIDKDFFRTRF